MGESVINAQAEVSKEQGKNTDMMEEGALSLSSALALEGRAVQQQQQQSSALHTGNSELLVRNEAETKMQRMDEIDRLSKSHLRELEIRWGHRTRRKLTSARRRMKKKKKKEY